jgi:predicted KAP-like P-loop ATPase
VPSNENDPKGSTLFSADLPLERVADDLLNRKRFSEELARAVGGWVGKESLVVALYGEWGSGKSTIKNFVIEALKTRSPEPIVGSYLPWQWSGQDMLLKGFLSELALILEKPEIAKQNDKIIKRFKVLAAAMQLGTGVADATRPLIAAVWLLFATYLGAIAIALGIPLQWVAGISLVFVILSAVAAAMTGFFKNVAEFLEAKQEYEKKSLEELRAAVAKEMEELKQPVIVFIDDLDRLTDTEIMLLFQLIKANVHFPNLIYCILCQKNIVVKALARVTSDDGDKYLRKIVQVAFDVPMASDAKLQKMLTEGLNRVLTLSQVTMTDTDNERWNVVFPDLLWPFFRNVRDVKRFLGAFEFYFGLHVYEKTLEVNAVDLVAIEVLRMFDHGAFQSVGASFFRGGITAFELFDDDKVEKNFASQIETIAKSEERTEAQSKMLQDLLYFLFPQAGKSARAGSSNDWHAGLRVCHEKHFSKYFQVSLDDGQPSARDLAVLIEHSNDRQKLVDIFKTVTEKGSLEDYLDFIMVSRDRIPTASMTSFITALFDVGDSYSGRKGAFTSDTAMQAIRIIFHRLKGEDVATRTDILLKALVATTGLGLPVRFVATEDKEARKRANKTEFLIDAADVPKFTDEVVKKLRAQALDGTLLDNESLQAILYRWYDWSDETEVRAWVEQTIQFPDAARKLLRKMMAKSFIGTREEPLLMAESLERFIDIEKLLAAVAPGNGIPVSKEDESPIDLLKRAVELKKTKQSYKEVRPLDSHY